MFRFPYCSLSIGFYIKKQAQIAVVYNPITDELFSAIAGQGAYCNGRTLVPSKQTGKTISIITFYLIFTVFFFYFIKILECLRFWLNLVQRKMSKK